MPYLPVARRQELLLDAGARVVARSGVAGATTRAVVTEAGMPLASFHYAFDSHEDFLRRLIERELVPTPPSLPAADEFEEALGLLVRELLAQDAATEAVAAELAVYALQHEGLRESTAKRMVQYDAGLAATLDALAARFDKEWVVPSRHLARQVNAWRFGTVIHGAYARRGSRYYSPSDGTECALLIARAARPPD